MKSLLLCLVLSLSLSALGRDGKSVSYKSATTPWAGMLYTPLAKPGFPTLIVIHEYWD